MSAVFDRLITHNSLRLGDGSSLGALSLGALWELITVAGIVVRMKIYPELNKVTINEDDLTLRMQSTPMHPTG